MAWSWSGPGSTTWSTHCSAPRTPSASSPSRPTWPGCGQPPGRAAAARPRLPWSGDRRRRPDGLTAARRICVLTGAGISTTAASPQPGAGRGVDPIRTTRSWSPSAYYLTDPRDPAPLVADAAGTAGPPTSLPTRGTARWSTSSARAGCDLVTQNVDGLDQAAGSSPERVLEVQAPSTRSSAWAAATGRRCGRPGPGGGGEGPGVPRLRGHPEVGDHLLRTGARRGGRGGGGGPPRPTATSCSSWAPRCRCGRPRGWQTSPAPARGGDRQRRADPVRRVADLVVRERIGSALPRLVAAIGEPGRRARRRRPRPTA